MLIGIREELMEGDLRSLYIVWLAGQRIIEGYYDEEEDEEEEDYEINVPPVPPAFGTLTAAQEALAELLRCRKNCLSRPPAIAAQPCHRPKMILAAWVNIAATRTPRRLSGSVSTQ